MDDIKRMSVKGFRTRGYLQELNRQFLHPMGLALEVVKDDDTGEERFGEVWDYRDDPEGMVMGDLTDPDEVARGERIEREFEAKAPTRRDRFGWHIQPLGTKVD